MIYEYSTDPEPPITNPVRTLLEGIMRTGITIEELRRELERMDNENPMRVVSITTLENKS